MERFDVAVVGAGLVGAAVAHDLAARGVRTVVLEAEKEPAAGASRSNSGVVHTGFDSVPGTFETAMIRAQSVRWRGVFDSLGVPYRETGALLTAIDDEEASRLPGMAEKVAENGVEIELLDAWEAKKLEPRSAAVGGLLVPGESITDPYEVVRRMLASSPNIETRLGWPVSSVEPDGEGAVLTGLAGKVAAGFVLNCAGLFADEISGNGAFRIVPRRGEFVVFGEGTADLVGRILLSCRPSGVPRQRGDPGRARRRSGERSGHDRRKADFEVEVASVGGFLRLLKERSEEIPGRQGHGAREKTVFVARMVDRRPSSYGYPLVRRYVMAAFAYGSNRISFTRTISNVVELPETMARIEDRQQAAYEEVRAEIERGPKDADLRVPVPEGLLRHVPADGR